MSVGEDLNRTLKEVVAESQAVREVATIAEHARRRLLAITLGVLVAGTVVLGLNLWSNIKTQQLVEAITSCTTPGRECYDRSQARTGEAVQRIIDGQIAAIECHDATDVRTCVEQKLGP